MERFHLNKEYHPFYLLPVLTKSGHELLVRGQQASSCLRKGKISKILFNTQALKSVLNVQHNCFMHKCLKEHNQDSTKDFILNLNAYRNSNLLRQLGNRLNILTQSMGEIFNDENMLNEDLLQQTYIFDDLDDNVDDFLDDPVLRSLTEQLKF